MFSEGSTHSIDIVDLTLNNPQILLLTFILSDRDIGGDKTSDTILGGE